MIVQLEEAKQRMSQLKEDVKELREALGIDALAEKADELEKLTCESDFWGREDAQSVMSELNTAKAKINDYTELSEGLSSLEDLVELAIAEDDESFTEEILNELGALTKSYERQRIEALLSGEFDKNNCILSIHPGAGGTEAQDWAEMLYRMYCRWAEKRGFKVKLLDYLDGDEAGIKSVTILISGNYAYGYLKSEGGVHRLVRVSPFDASGRRHTSFASVEVMPELEDDSSIEIRDEDIEVETHRASGAGGQHINKTESAIRITHKPTGIVVTCQDERSQHKNREAAMKMLRSRLYDKMEQERSAAIAADRKSQVGTGDRSERIRTYNFPQGRMTDHRIGLTLYRLEQIMNGDLDEIIDALITTDQSEKLKSQAEGNI